MEFATLVPGICNVSIPPMKIDCDNNVLWYTSVYKESPLCVYILTKDVLEHDENISRQDIVRCGYGNVLTVCPNDELQNGDIDYFEQRETCCANLNAAEVLETWDVRESMVDQNVDDVHVNVDELCNDTSVPQLTVDIIPTQVGSSVRIPESEDVHVKDYFKCKKSLKSKLELLAMRCHFEFKVKKSNKSLYSIACIDENCKWRLRATKMKESDMFEVRKYFGLHTCSLSVRRIDNKHASYSIIGSQITSKYEDPSRVYTPKNIIDDVRDEFNIKISYTKAYMAKEFAMAQLRGSPDESYAILPSYCAVLKQRNPGTFTAIESSIDKRFKYFFMALGQSIRGFQASIRRVISVDGTFLTNRYRGTLLIASCQDANVQIYPLAWAIVDSENEDSWAWFFHKLKEVTGDTEELVIISDRGKSIPKAFQRN